MLCYLFRWHLGHDSKQSKHTKSWLSHFDDKGIHMKPEKPEKSISYKSIDWIDGCLFYSARKCPKVERYVLDMVVYTWRCGNGGLVHWGNDFIDDLKCFQLNDSKFQHIAIISPLNRPKMLQFHGSILRDTGLFN